MSRTTPNNEYLLKPLIVPSGDAATYSSTDASSHTATASAPRRPPPPPSTITTTVPTSAASSRSSSPTAASDLSDELPSNVCSEEQLTLLPPECLSGDLERPLRHVDEMGDVFNYSLTPMTYSVTFILLVELLERFAFYGINYTETLFLTGAYDEDWNAGMEAVAASTYVSVSVALAYTAPFFGAIMADSFLGDYWTILVGSIFFYIPGILLIACTTVPGLLGDTFNRSALSVGLLFLWPIGTGVVKSCVNVFGARQFHPLLQSSMIESYYVRFFMCINIGALVGGIMVPVVAEHSVSVAYFLPVGMLALCIAVFILGTSRYVRTTPKGSMLGHKELGGGAISSGDGNMDLSGVIRILLLVVPFNIAYCQMATTFIVQGTVMKKALGFIDAASINNAEAIALLAFGSFVGNQLYPWLAQRGIKIPTAYKFAIGSALGALAILWALLVEYLIHSTYHASGKQISIMWQAMSYILIGVGEIFAVSTSYEAAFTASPPEMKVLSSALNLFLGGGLPSIICIFLYQACSSWFKNSHGEARITHLHDYATAHVSKYFWVLFVISVVGVVINLLPSVRDFVESVEEKATDLLKSPRTPMRSPRRTADEESSALLRARRHREYLKYGSGPVLYKSGSMRAGPSLAKAATYRRLPKIGKTIISRLYRSEPVVPGVSTSLLKSGGKPLTMNHVMLNTGGKPVTAGTFMKLMQREEEPLNEAPADAGVPTASVVHPIRRITST